MFQIVLIVSTILLNTKRCLHPHSFIHSLHFVKTVWLLFTFKHFIYLFLANVLCFSIRDFLLFRHLSIHVCMYAFVSLCRLFVLALAEYFLSLFLSLSRAHVHTSMYLPACLGCDCVCIGAYVSCSVFVPVFSWVYMCKKEEKKNNLARRNIHIAHTHLLICRQECNERKMIGSRKANNNTLSAQLNYTPKRTGDRMIRNSHAVRSHIPNESANNRPSGWFINAVAGDKH